MRRIILLFAAIVAFTACHKRESLVICFANAYDQTIVVKCDEEEFPINSGKLWSLCFSGSSGSTPVGVQSEWERVFYNKYDAVTVYTADGKTVLESWKKGEDAPGTPFSLEYWSKEDKVESGVDGGLKDGLAYTFLVSAYTRTNYNLTYVFGPRE